MVYKAYITAKNQVISDTVAIKTLKGILVAIILAIVPAVIVHWQLMSPMCIKAARLEN